MPTLGSPQEITDVIAFLDWVGRSTPTAGRLGRSSFPAWPYAACPASPASAAADPVSRGKALFNGRRLCQLPLHRAGMTLVGPSLAGIATTAEGRFQHPQYAGAARRRAEYLEESVLKPSVFIVPGGLYASPQGVSFMPDTFAQTLTSEQMRDFVAYLMTLQ